MFDFDIGKLMVVGDRRARGDPAEGLAARHAHRRTGGRQDAPHGGRVPGPVHGRDARSGPGERPQGARVAEREGEDRHVLRSRRHDPRRGDEGGGAARRRARRKPRSTRPSRPRRKSRSFLPSRPRRRKRPPGSRRIWRTSARSSKRSTRRRWSATRRRRRSRRTRSATSEVALETPRPDKLAAVDAPAKQSAAE